MIRQLTAISLAIAAVATMSGCTAGMAGMNESVRPDDVNQADVMFVQMMIPHHRDALEMVELILDKDGVDTEVTELAENIHGAQEPEIATMEGWLDDWGIDGGMDDMDHGAGGMMGEDLDALESAAGDTAEQLFLEQMIRHHDDAIQMADDEVENGENSDVIDLAESIKESQTAEIIVMRALLSRY